MEKKQPHTIVTFKKKSLTLLGVSVFFLIVSLCSYMGFSSLRKDLDSLHDYQFSSVDDFEKFLGSHSLFSGYESSVLLDSAGMIQDSYTLLLSEKPSDLLSGLFLLDQASRILDKDARVSLSSYEEQLIENQLDVIGIMKHIGTVKSCFSSSYSFSYLGALLKQKFSSLLVRLQQIENILTTLSLHAADYVEKECIDDQLRAIRYLRDRMLLFFHTIDTGIVQTKHFLSQVRQDLDVCGSLDVAHIPDLELLSQQVQDLEKYLQRYDDLDVSGYDQELCVSDDAHTIDTSREVADHMQTLADQVQEYSSVVESLGMNQGFSGDLSDPYSTNQGSGIFDDGGEGHEENGDSSYDSKESFEDIAPEDIQEYSTELLNRGLFWKNSLQEFYQGSLSSPEDFLRDTYIEFYGDDDDFLDSSH